MNIPVIVAKRLNALIRRHENNFKFDFFFYTPWSRLRSLRTRSTARSLRGLKIWRVTDFDVTRALTKHVVQPECGSTCSTSCCTVFT